MPRKLIDGVPHDLSAPSLRELLIARAAGLGSGFRGRGH
jgi:hypothetical protein